MKFFRALTLLMAFILVTTSVPGIAQAQSEADAGQSIQTILDTFHYRMIVEWDQRDVNFRKFAIDELNQSFENLKKEGISDEEILLYFRQVSTNQSMNIPNNTLEAALSYINQIYHQGVSFNPTGIHAYDRFGVLGALIIGGSIVILVASIVRIMPITISN